jgi:hypothetical protein
MFTRSYTLNPLVDPYLSTPPVHAQDISTSSVTVYPCKANWKQTEILHPKDKKPYSSPLCLLQCLPHLAALVLLWDYSLLDLC